MPAPPTRTVPAFGSGGAFPTKTPETAPPPEALHGAADQDHPRLDPAVPSQRKHPKPETPYTAQPPEALRVAADQDHPRLNPAATPQLRHPNPYSNLEPFNAGDRDPRHLDLAAPPPPQRLTGAQNSIDQEQPARPLVSTSARIRRLFIVLQRSGTAPGVYTILLPRNIYRKPRTRPPLVGEKTEEGMKKTMKKQTVDPRQFVSTAFTAPVYRTHRTHQYTSPIRSPTCTLQPKKLHLEVARSAQGHRLRHRPLVNRHYPHHPCLLAMATTALSAGWRKFLH